MVHVDVAKVRGKMAEKGFNITTLSDQLSVSRGTLAAYLDTPGKMPYNVVSKLASILCENAEEASAIFFADDFRKT